MVLAADYHLLYHLGALVSLVALAFRGQYQLRIILLLSFVLYLADDWYDYADHAWPYLIWNLLFLGINVFVLIEMVLDRTTFGLSEEEKRVLAGLLSLTLANFVN